MFICSFTTYANYNWEKRVGDDGIEHWYYKLSRPHNDNWVTECGYMYYITSSGRLVTDSFDGYVFNIDENSDIPYGALLEANQVRTYEKDVNGHTYLEVKRQNLDNYNKIIIMLHGLSGNKSEYKYHATEAAANNVLVLVPEIYGHEGTDIANVGQMVLETSKWIDELLDVYMTENITEVDILGCSLGGMIGSYYVTHGKYTINKIAMLISTLNYQSLRHDIFRYSYKNGQVYMKISDGHMIDSLNKISDNHDFKNTYIRMYNTKKDPYMPYDKTKLNAKHLEQITLPYTGHTVKEKDFQDAIRWLLKEI